jgi:hypothetical protein
MKVAFELDKSKVVIEEELKREDTTGTGYIATNDF